MKTLKFNQEEYKAEKIIKTENSIIGQDLQGNEAFAFRGISDFSLFELEDGQSFDVGEIEMLQSKLLEQQRTIEELMFNVIPDIIGGGM